MSQTTCGSCTGRPGTDARFALGLTHSLAKVWPSKHWFRGESMPSAPGEAGPLKGAPLWIAAGGLGDDFWTTLALESKPGGYPYGGIHNGNNFLVYPPQSETVRCCPPCA